MRTSSQEIIPGEIPFGPKNINHKIENNQSTDIGGISELVNLDKSMFMDWVGSSELQIYSYWI